MRDRARHFSPLKTFSGLTQRLTMICLLLRQSRETIGSKVWRKAMPLAMSSANFTAWLWSTTRAKEGEGHRDRKGRGRFWPFPSYAWAKKPKKTPTNLHTSALVEYVVEGSVGHVVGNDYWVRRWRRLTSTKNRQDVWMREDPVGTQ